MRPCVVSGLAGFLIGGAACGDNALAPTPENPIREAYGTWLMIEPPGAVCGNGSPFRFFVNFSPDSDDLAVVYEPGGACWDFDSCTGRNGIRGAANVNGIGDDHWQLGEVISPFLSRLDGEVPTQTWNHVFVPYCTGDVHTGNRVATYADPTGAEADIDFHHRGHDNTMRVVEWLDDSFVHVPRMLVTGCSAGGAGALTNYYYLRKGVAAVDRGYLLDDSGPIFPSSGYSAPMHRKIRESWDIDSLLDALPVAFDRGDLGSINLALAAEFPDDRLATTYFRRDWNFSLYSYERFYDLPPASDPAFKREIMRMWDSDTELLTRAYDGRDNLAYYIPYWRALNDSHCTTLVGFRGSEIQDAGMKLDDWVAELLDDDAPLRSAIEAPVVGEDE
jgi:hypothetical protein